MNKQQEPRLRFKGFTGAWEYKKFENVLSIKSGMSQKEIEVSDGIYPILATGGEIGRTNTALYDKESVLIGRKGTIDKPYYMNTPFWTVDTLFYSELKNNIDGKFLYFLFQCIEWRKLDTSTGVPSLTSTTIHEIQRYFPSKPEQTHLGLFFRRLDSLIAESRAVLEKSRQLKKAMLAKMFPTNGEKIPKIRFKGFEGEWESRKLGIEVEIIGGGTPDTTNSAYWNGDIDWYSPTEIGEAAYANGSVKKITLLGLQKSSAQILPANRTVLFTSRASIGDMAILTKDGSTNQGFQSFVVGERLDVYFFYTMGFKIKDYALKNASGSTFLEISKNTLSQMEFFAPSLKEQTAIGNFFRQLDETIALQSAEVEKLNRLKKGLLAAMLV